MGFFFLFSIREIYRPYYEKHIGLEKCQDTLALL